MEECASRTIELDQLRPKLKDMQTENHQLVSQLLAVKVPSSSSVRPPASRPPARVLALVRFELSDDQGCKEAEERVCRVVVGRRAWRSVTTKSTRCSRRPSASSGALARASPAVLSYSASRRAVNPRLAREAALAHAYSARQTSSLSEVFSWLTCCACA